MIIDSDPDVDIDIDIDVRLMRKRISEMQIDHTDTLFPNHCLLSIDKLHFKRQPVMT